MPYCCRSLYHARRCVPSGIGGWFHLARVESNGRRRQALLGANGDEPLEELLTLEEFNFVPEAPPHATIFLVAQSFRMLSRAILSGESVEPSSETGLCL